MKRTLSFLLAVLMLLPLMAACGNRRLTIIKNGECTVLYDPNTVSNGDLNRLTTALEETTGVEVEPITSGDVEKGWILVGNVELNGKRVSAELRSNDCFAGIAENYYLLGGTSTQMVADAIDHFIENVLPLAKKDGQKLTVAAADNYEVMGTYRVEGLSIGGESLGQFTIVVPDKYTLSEYRTAVVLQQHILQTAGYSIPVKTEEEASSERIPRICVGKSLSPHTVTAHEYAIGIEGKTMYISAESFLGYEAAQAVLSNRVFHAKNETPQMDDSFVLTGDGADRATAPLTADGDLRLMFSNIHGYDQDNGQTPVKEASQQLAELFLTYLPDVLGTQEFSPNSYNAQLDGMIASEYEQVNVATGGNYKTYTALFYRKSTMELLDSGYLGFNSLTYNEYPELLGSASASQVKHNNLRQTDGKSITQNGRQDNSKGVTWGIFRVKATGKVILVGSTHLWWESNEPLDEIARKVQIMALREHLSEKAAAFMTAKGLSGALPIFVGGDYNTSLSRDNTALSVMERAGNTFCHVNTQATVKLTTTTHHGYATFNHDIGIYEAPQYSSGKANAAIDHIYMNSASTGFVKVNRLGILSDLYAHLSSDHNPIYTDITLLDSAPKLTV